MNNQSTTGLPEFPENILARKRQQELSEGPGTARRTKEKMFAEAVSNFRAKLNCGMSEEELRLVLQFFQRSNISVSIAYYRNSDPGVRITSPVINSFISITNPQSIFLVCDILGYKLNSNRTNQQAEQKSKQADSLNRTETTKRDYALMQAAKMKERIFDRKNVPLLRFFSNQRRTQI